MRSDSDRSLCFSLHIFRCADHAFYVHVDLEYYSTEITCGIGILLTAPECL